MSSGFISEADAQKAREQRQEEWEKVRTASDPIDLPEEPYDHRSLFEKLQEQKAKKDLEYEEAHKLKNMIKGLDDDEVEFLDLVDRSKMAADRKKFLEDEHELNDYRNRVASLQEDHQDKRVQAEIATSKKSNSGGNKNTQGKLLQGVVIRKSNDRKRKASASDDITKDDSVNVTEAKTAKVTDDAEKQSVKVIDSTKKQSVKVTDDVEEVSVKKVGLQCIGILPGLGHYTDSSEEENSSSDAEPEQPNPAQGQLDLLGRKIIFKEVKE